MKKRYKIIIAIVLPISVLMGFFGYYSLRPEIFIMKQSSYLKSFGSIEEIYQADDKFIVTHVYPDKSWVALKFEHSCCSGEGFDCIVARDEKNNLYINKGFSICGYESSGELFRYIKAKNSQEFFSNSAMYNNLKFKKTD